MFYSGVGARITFALSIAIVMLAATGGIACSEPELLLQTPVPTTTTLSPLLTTTPSPLSTATPTVAELVEGLELSVVQIVGPSGTGSGIVISTNGLVITNAHVVDRYPTLQVRMPSGLSYQGIVVGLDEKVDIALIQLRDTRELKPVVLGNSDTLAVGDEVIAMGFPFGSPTLTKGIVSRKFIEEEVERIQTDAALNPGNSGGPLFNRDGQLVGVNTYIWARDDSGMRIDGIGFAISVNMVKDYLPVLRAGWFAIRDTTSIQSGKSIEFRVNGVAGASIVYEFQVDTRSNSSLDIDFRIIGPTEEVLVRGHRVQNGDGSLTAPITGQYTLIFDNSFSILTPKTIVLVYATVPSSIQEQ